MVWSLAWSDVDPATHPFDPERAQPIIEHVLAGRNLLRSVRDELEDDVDRALIAEYGFWAAGFRWSASEPGCGGPVRGWCCAQDSLKGADAAVRLRGALVEFRSFLEDLAKRYEQLRRDNADLAVGEQIERAAAQLLPLVLERTSVEDAWYSTFERVMTWFVEPGFDESVVATAAVRDAIGGRFHSWCAPDESTARDVLRSLSAITDRAAAREAEDTLSKWLEIRGRVAWREERHYAPGRVPQDGHVAYVERIEARRDPARAARMRDALVMVREAATLNFETLCAAQTIVLGRTVAFRETPAFAKRGRERYGAFPGLRERFEECLAEACSASPQAVARAARVYLDVCFFHPFDDGNARAARLALDWVLTRAGLALHAAEPLFVVSRSARDQAGARSFVFLVDYLAGPR